MSYIIKVHPISTSTYQEADDFCSSLGMTNNIFPYTQAAMRKLVIDFKDTGLWNKMVAIYPMYSTEFYQSQSPQYFRNLKDPRDLDVAYRLSITGNVFGENSFGSPRVVALPQQSNNFTCGLNTHFKPYSLNHNFHVSAFILGGGGDGRLIFGCRDLNSGSIVSFKAGTSGTYNGTFTSNLISVDYDPTNGPDTRKKLFINNELSGHYIYNRRSSNKLELYYEGVKLIDDNTQESLDSPNASLGLMNMLYTSGSTEFMLSGETTFCNYVFATVGESLSETECETLSKIVRVFNRTLRNHENYNWRLRGD